jgi:5-carboxymethyl-2-hydroxymuconate isomerase
MPHLIIEHSADISPSAIQSLQKEILNIMPSVAEGNFDPDQCKCRSFAFGEYLVGKLSQEESSFLHITIKILSGRSAEVKKQLAEKSLAAAKKIYETLEFSPSATDKIVEVAHQIADTITGVGHIAIPANSELINKRCDISVDIVDMECATYQKIRIGN